jgi:hypothetical protein
MRSWIFGAITLACLTIGASAAACPVGEARPPRPRPIQNVSFQVSEMLERASNLESAAAVREDSARALERQVETFMSRARALRSQAQLVNVSDRRSILEIADELADRAAADRARAARERAQASELRLQAATLRQRAIQLVRLETGTGSGGGGWWKRPPPPRVSVPEMLLPSEAGTNI